MISTETLFASFPKERVPEYPCPRCNASVLGMIDGSWQSFEEDCYNSSDPNFDPEGLKYVFTCVLKCKADACQTNVVCTGTGTTYRDETPGELYGNYCDSYTANYFEPPLAIIDIPADCPHWVAASVREASSVLFFSRSTALNRLRVALEFLFDELEVPRTKQGKKSEYFLSFKDLSLIHI